MARISGTPSRQGVGYGKAVISSRGALSSLHPSERDPGQMLGRRERPSLGAERHWFAMSGFFQSACVQLSLSWEQKQFTAGCHGFVSSGKTIMKILTIVFASAFVLSSSFALASTHHKKHRSGAGMHRSHHGAHHTGRRY